MFRGKLLSVLLAGLCALPAMAKCGGPETLFEWGASSKSDSDSSGDDSGKEKPLESDRPGFGDCPSAVGCDRCELEIGYQYSYDREANTSEIQHTYPQSLLRVGALANWFELRVSWSQEQDTDRVFGVSSHTDVGSQDMSVGFKIALTDQDHWLPKTGLVVDATVPTGSEAFTTHKFLPEVEYIYEWELTKQLTFDAVTELSDFADDVTDREFLAISEAAGVQRKLNEQLSAYVQWHITTPHEADTFQTQQVFEGGLILLLSNNLQWDGEYGVGLNSATPDYFVGTGLSMRR
ncbi:MAG TPA: transporter [Lacipirellulaceae bacterium]|nr:transporter [Lacipirellulaceae bacterium]